MNWLALISDGAWIIGLSLISSGSYQAWMRIEADARVPLQFGKAGAAGIRASKPVALLLTPLLAGFLAAVFYISARMTEGRPEALFLTIVSIGLPPLLSLVHFQHLDRAMKVLGEEGGLRR